MNNTFNQTEPPVLNIHNGFDVYPMPMFISMETADTQALAAWYINTLGFAEMFKVPGNNDKPKLIHLRRGKYQDILIRLQQDSPESNSIRTSLCFQAYGEIDAIVEHAAQQPTAGDANIGQAIDTPWNTRTVTLRDPDGRQLTLSHPRFDPELTKRISADFRADQLSRS